MIVEKNELIDEVVRRLDNRNLSVFIGAGLSCRASGLDWERLCEPYMDKLALENCPDYVTGLQYYVTQEKVASHDIKEEIAVKFRNLEPDRRHEILVKLPIRNYWTTNFDAIIEGALSNAGRSYVVMHNDKSFENSDTRRDGIVYKLHGDVTSPDDMVILKDDYDRYHKTHGNFILALAHELTMQSMLFLGYGMNDPDINNIMTYIEVANDAAVPHYMITRREEGAKQEYAVEELGRRGINVCLVSDYDEIDDILESVYRKFMARKVLVCGSSCGGYGKFSETEAKDMLEKLGYKLTDDFCGDEEFKLVSGYGLNVGPILMEGAAQAVVAHDLDFGKRLLIYPFPSIYYSTPDDKRPEKLKKDYREYREKMIGRCGTVFFLFGTKKDGSGETIDATGVMEEFEIAVEQKKYVFPIGVTGGASKTLADRVTVNFERYNDGVPQEVEEEYRRLNSPEVTANGIIEGICRIVGLLAQNSADNLEG